MRRLETSIEESWVLWVKQHYPDWFVIKLKAIGMRGWPDRLIIGPGPTLYFIEFKRPGEKPRKLQDWLHDKLRRWGFNVWVCTTKKEAQEIFQGYLQT